MQHPEASHNQSSASDPVASEVLAQIVDGTYGAAAEILGPHRLPAPDQHGATTVVRAFLPGTKAARILTHVGDDVARVVPIDMECIHPGGIFSARCVWETLPPYEIEATYLDDSQRRSHDPYAFGPQLSDFDLYLLGEGTHYTSYDVLGAHPRTIGGVTGVLFAVWAPGARRMSVIGDFNRWDERISPMRPRSGGIWELFIPDVRVGELYKFAVLSWHDDYRVQKADPYAFASELRPGTASRVCDLTTYTWSDDDWMRARLRANSLGSPMLIYELHAGSWRADPGTEAHPHVTYRELAHQLVPYLREMGYTHVELLPVMEHPLDASWGYQVTGYFAATSRFGSPQDFMYFVDYCHQHGIGVLLDWVPAHFPKDQHALHYFDGSHLYEYADPRLGEHPDWGTVVFDYGRPEVVNFLLASGLFWLDRYHIDGLRVDAVASILYLDYSREPGEWLPNRYGGRENLEAVAFLRRFNELVYGRFPGTVTIAEESTAWPLVSRPTYVGGLGFTYKWNMGWMHDMLHYMAHDPIHRRFHHNELTFSLMYAFSENYILPFSHDEVVHLKASMLKKMPGDQWRQFANLRSLYAYMYGHPGKKLLFMGGEFGQLTEWNESSWLQWSLLEASGAQPSPHAQLRTLVRDLNRLVATSPALYQLDNDPAGFEWIDCNDADNSIVAFIRSATDHTDQVVFVCNFTPIARAGYRIGVPRSGYYAETLNTDARVYGGSNIGNQGGMWSEPVEHHGRANSISITLPPLGVVVFHVHDVAPSLPAVDAADQALTVQDADAPSRRHGSRRAHVPAPKNENKGCHTPAATTSDTPQPTDQLSFTGAERACSRQTWPPGSARG